MTIGSLFNYQAFSYNIITVDAAGSAQFKAIQEAIDSITDATVNNQYDIRINPGTYTENITLKDYVNLSAISGYGTVTITSSSGTMLSYNGTGQCALDRLYLVSTPTASTDKIIDDTGSGRLIINKCEMVVNANNVGIRAVNVAAGTTLLFDCAMTYTATGNSGAGIHNVLYASGDCIMSWVNSLIDLNINETSNSVVIAVEEATTATVVSIFAANRVQVVVNNASWAGLAGIYYANGIGATKLISTSGWFMQNAAAANGSAWATFIDSTSGEIFGVSSCTIDVIGFANNYAGNVAAGDTLNICNSAINAADDYTGAGTINICSTINGALRYTQVQEFADNSAAKTGGLVDGDIYRTGDDLKIVHS